MQKVAIFYQSFPIPAIDGVSKPQKETGYRDSSADISFAVSKRSDVTVIYPCENQPNPLIDEEWCFPDTPEGINCAIEKGANTFWMNVSLFSSHPSSSLPSHFKVVNNPPLLVEKYDDKRFTNHLLKQHGINIPLSLTILANPKPNFPTSLPCILLSHLQSNPSSLLSFGFYSFPIICKPIRGRGSQGVCLVHSFSQLISHITSCFSSSLFGDEFLLEQYLPGEEITVAVFPPGSYIFNNQSILKNEYWSSLPVLRFNHQNGIAPYNRVVAVSANSRVLTQGASGTSIPSDQALNQVLHQCCQAAKIIGAKSVIRIDVRFDSQIGYLFDLNLKPNMTGSGRNDTRRDQENLVTLSVQPLSWDYPQLVYNLLRQAY